jgi:potassium efflux system protein
VSLPVRRLVNGLVNGLVNRLVSRRAARARGPRALTLALVVVALSGGALAQQGTPQGSPQGAPQAAAARPQHPALDAAIAVNGELARQVSDPAGLSQRARAVEVEVIAATATYTQLHRDCETLERALSTSGLTNSVRASLRRLRSSLPDLLAHRRRLQKADAELDAAQLQMLDFEHRRDALDDLSSRLSDEMASLSPAPSDADRPAIEAALREALIDRRDLLDSLIDAANDTYAHLAALVELEQKIVDETRDARAWIDGSSLWLRDAVPLSPSAIPIMMEDGIAAVRWLVRPSNWAGLGRSLWADTLGNPLMSLITLMLIMLLLRQRPRLAARLGRTAEQVGNLRRDRFRPTAEAFVLTLILAGLMPVVLLLLAWRLQASATSRDFTMAVTAGLYSTALLALALNVLSEICRPRGLGEAHLLWPAGVTASLRRHVGMLVGAVLPATFIVSTLLAHGRDPWSESLGRVVFMLACVVLASVLHHMLRPAGKVMLYVTERNRQGMLARARVAWVAPLVVLPLLFALLSAMGYYSTALKLQLRVQNTVWLLAGLAVVHVLLLRWLFIARRRLAMMLARQRADAAARSSAAGEDADEDEEDADVPDLGSLNLQTRRIVALTLGLVLVVGCWMIWRDVLAGLNVLERVSLWTHRVESMSEMTGPNGELLLDADGHPRVETSIRQVSVTLADILVSVMLAVLTIVAARNVPGLLQISILQRLPLDAGSRYAISTLTRYLLVIVGIVVVFGSIGIGWGQVQWMAAAVTVGLGFGLQEIFANFVSGIILLMERPIRVGDTVTVGGVTGTVMRIRMRATTIEDWDRKELVVPNKEFITNQLVNWTLGDSILRVIVKVGIAYGSDTAKATKLLYEVAAGNPKVLDDPAPRVVFQEFGDSSLNFELRFFVGNPETVRVIPHEMNMAIDAAFRAAGIEIAFPQRDIHIRSVTHDLHGALQGPGGKA